MKFKSWAGAIIVAGAALAAVLPLRLLAADDPKAIDDYNFSAWLYNSGKYAMATESYQNFLKSHPDHAKAPDARFGLAQSYFHQDNFKDAAEQYEALRAVFVEGLSQKDAALRFGYTYGALRQLVLEFRSAFSGEVS